MKNLLLFLALLCGGLLYGQTLALPIDFESGAISYTFTDFGGGVGSRIANPQMSGINTSANVGRMVKSAPEVWGGAFLQTANPIDFSLNKIMKMKVYSPRVGARVLLKVENISNGGIFFEKEDTSTVANAWEELTFDFSAINTSNTYQKVVLIWDLGVVGDGSPNFTFLFDDIIQTSSGGPILSQIDLPITFDNALVDYTMIDFGGNASVVGAGPVGSAGNVGSVTKGLSAQTWAGTTMSTGMGLDNAIPFAVGATTMSIRVWSPDAGIPIRLKVEDHTNAAISCETEAMTTIANAWDTLVFDFSNQAMGTAALNLSNTYDKASIFFNFGTDGATAGVKTYHFDNVMFGIPTMPLNQIDLPVTFEDANVDYTMTDFGGNANQVIVDPNNALNKIAEVIKSNTAATWAGTTIGTPMGFATAIPFTLTATTMSVKVWSPDAGIQIRLKVEDHTNPTRSCETEATTTMANAWETLVFDFSNEAPGTATLNLTYTFDMASIFFNFGVDGATAGVKTYYFDDVAFGSSISLNQIDLPVTFEDANVDYTMTDFGGNASQVIVDPNNALNNISETVKGASAQTWAGTTIGTATGFATAIPFAATATTMSVKVWSPDAGIQVRLKVEDHTNATISVETEATTTMANAWETLVFDFSNEASGTAPLNLGNTYDKASIFFNFGVDGATAGAKTYYFDDVMFGMPVNPLMQIDLPITFEDTMVDYTMTDFGGNASQRIVDPNNALNHVREVIKTTAAQSWAGTTMSTPMGLATAIPFTANGVFVSARVWSPDAGIQIRLKAEDHTNGSISVETEKTTTVANGWETLAFDFSNEVVGTAPLNLGNTYDLLSIFFNFGVDGATAGQKTYYFDDVEFGNSVAVTAPALAGLRYFPNPTTGSVRIQAEQDMESIEVYDMMGRMVLQQATAAPQVQIDLSTLESGVYMVSVHAQAAKSSFRIVKQ